MVKRGGRTTVRMTEDVFTTDLVDKGKPPNISPRERYCKAICEVFCTERDGVLQEMTKPHPDHTTIGESITDFKTIGDMAEGGKCQCDCPPVQVIFTPR